MTPVLDPPRIAVPGSLAPLMDNLVELAESINETQGLSDAERLSIFRWKPARAPARWPALWHWLTGGPPPEQKDLNRIRDHIAISAYIGTRHADQDKDMARMERMADAYREAIDPQIYRPRPGGPLGGTATWASRQGMRLVAVEFAGIECIAFEFPLEFQLDRSLIKND